jgi:hypothetical protein
MAYFAMLSGQGWTAIAGCRQFFYARYADWIVTTTLIVILLGQVANAGNDVIFGACGANGRTFLSWLCSYPSQCSPAYLSPSCHELGVSLPARSAWGANRWAPVPKATRRSVHSE